MSLLLKTIEAFPLGRTTSELIDLLDVSFDSAKREVVRRELAEAAVPERYCTGSRQSVAGRRSPPCANTS